jgi:sulfide dehydrogenase cytochrome subunit
VLARLIAAMLLASLPIGIAKAGPADAPPGASSCSGCHSAGQAGITPVPRLIGRKPAELIQSMRAFRSGQAPTTIMDRIAKGFSDDEIAPIAAWYGAQQD